MARFIEVKLKERPAPYVVNLEQIVYLTINNERERLAHVFLSNNQSIVLQNDYDDFRLVMEQMASRL